MALTRADIAQKIQRELEISKSTSADLIELLLATIKTTLSTGEDLMLSPSRVVTFYELY